MRVSLLPKSKWHNIDQFLDTNTNQGVRSKRFIMLGDIPCFPVEHSSPSPLFQIFGKLGWLFIPAELDKKYQSSFYEKRLQTREGRPGQSVKKQNTGKDPKMFGYQLFRILHLNCLEDIVLLFAPRLHLLKNIYVALPLQVIRLY